MMIGINNVIHVFKNDKPLDFKKFQDDLEELLLQLKDAGIIVLFLEPFLLPAPDKRRYRPLFNKELEIVHELATKYADEFVAYDEMFNGVAQSIPYQEFSEDGVHPTHRGSRLIADTAIKVLRRYLL
jgi:lysophospholipase L1-like esterase